MAYNKHSRALKTYVAILAYLLYFKKGLKENPFKKVILYRIRSPKN